MVRQRSSTQEERYLAAFDSFERGGRANDPAWLRHLRRSAIERFGELGFPTARRGNEEWKYTDVAPIARLPFDLAGAYLATQAVDVERFRIDAAGWATLVFIDGAYSPVLSTLPAISANVTVTSFRNAVSEHTGRLDQSLARYAGYEDDAFIALNTAFVDDGALIEVPDGVQLNMPVQLLFVSTSASHLSTPRVLISLGRDSKAIVVESYAGATSERYFVNAVSEIVLGAGSILQHYRSQQHSFDAFHVGNTRVSQGPASTFTSVVLDTGGDLVRNNLNVDLAGENSSCSLSGLYMVNGTQHVDNQVIIDHKQPYTTSRELYKGILDGRSRAVFHGSITVREGARKSDAQQTDRNLLLSSDCEADTKPALWIYCDDVKCGHGAASGQIDERALFYLRSRGLDADTARRLLIRAFAGEIIESVQNEEVRAYLDKIFVDQLPNYNLG